MGRIRTRMKSTCLTHEKSIRISTLFSGSLSLIIIAGIIGVLDGLEVDNLTYSTDDCPKPITVTCSANFTQPHDSSLIVTSWFLNGEEMKEQGVKSTEDYNTSALYYYVLPCNISYFGNLTCRISRDGHTSKAEKSVIVRFPVAPTITPTEDVRVNGNTTTSLRCTAQGYPRPNISWTFEGAVLESKPNVRNISTLVKGETSVTSTLTLFKVGETDNGTYVCHANNSSPPESKQTLTLYVQTKPKITINSALGVGKGSIYFNWTLNDGNLPIEEYLVKYLKEEDGGSWQFSSKAPNATARDFVIAGLEADTTYKIQIEGKNQLGRSAHEYDTPVRTLSADAEYTPVIGFKGSSSNSFTLGWTAAPEEIRHLIGYYNAFYKEEKGSGEKMTEVRPADGETIHLFNNLKPATYYEFRFQACHRYTGRCGNFSNTVKEKTLDGKPSPPRNVQMRCERNGNRYYATVSWNAPIEPNGQLLLFTVNLTGVSYYLNERLQLQRDDFGPMTQPVENNKNQAFFDGLTPYTNYTVSVNTETKIQKSESSNASCQMPASVPDKEKLNGLSLIRYQKAADKWGLKANLPKVSQRNGPVCCYSIVLVKMGDGVSISSLPEPHHLPLLSYDDVHRKGDGAYLAEQFDVDRIPSDVSFGDGNRIDPLNPPCRYCSSITASSGDGLDTKDDQDLESENRFERSSSQDVRANLLNSASVSNDGALLPDSNYTLFVRLSSPTSQGVIENVYSSYASPMTPKPSAPQYQSTDRSLILMIALGVLCGLALVLLFVLSSLFLLRRYSKHVAPNERDQLSLSSSCRHLWSRFRDGRHLLVSQPAISDIPIAKQDILQAYLDRHQNADYGFQHEYERLPELTDKLSTRSSDARENLHKNRYPDIKAFDHTRVKLSILNGDPYSDYINANIVMGYKERKKFVCAQGPMEGTVYDFWRMAWEQRVEIIVMLTNVEEYNKTKCFQYWPDPDPSRGTSTPEPLYIDPVAETQSNGGTTHSPSNGSTVDIQSQPATLKTPKGDKTFGDIRVIHVKEKRYSEYVVRELQVSRPKVGTPTDPELGVMEREVRPVFQYHYLVWKDFQAPEHATGILRFLRRLNEDYSTDRGPILIHCSAGVGRTGTLVAIDHLIQQVEEEGSVSVFNTVVDLRRQRNFLVQSLRQYIFVYRTLMEWVQFGNTETTVKDYKNALATLKTKSEGKTKSLLEEEFDRLDQPFDDRKPMGAASQVENRDKNRYESAIPYDRNRVILTPVAAREFSTYINASFIEGYDNSESFILTQDPIESTQRDFWRMVLEHNIAAIVMLSEMGEESDKSCCSQYWPDDDQEATHDHILVKHVSTVTLPGYIQRDFVVRSTKTREEIRTTQIQFLGWGLCTNGLEDDTVPSSQQMGHFVTVAMEAIAARARQLLGGSTCIHCSTGSIRSSVMAALCILIDQARTEDYVDVFSTVRKLRSQRTHMIKYPTQYAFLYDALAYFLTNHPPSVSS